MVHRRCHAADLFQLLPTLLASGTVHMGKMLLRFFSSWRLTDASKSCWSTVAQPHDVIAWVASTLY